MRILLISQYAGSIEMGMEYRPFCLAREWLRTGDRTLIVAGSYSHLRRTNPAGVRGGFLREEGILFRMLPTPDYCGNGFGRVQNVGRFLWELSRRCGVLARDFSPDAVICASTHPFDFTAGKRIAQQSGAALVFELHDIWPLSLIELHGFSERHPLMRLIDRAESRAFEQSDGVVSLLPGLPRYLEERGIVPKRLICIPNGATCPSGRRSADGETLHRFKALKKEYGSLVVYAGGFARANAVGRLAELACQLPRTAFAAIGEGVEKAAVAAAAPENLPLFDPVKPEALVPLLQEADLLWIATENLPLYRYGVSMNKLFDYMGAGRPVVFETPCLENPISICGCGITVPPSDKIETRRAVETLLRLSPAERGVIGERGRRAVAGRYGYPALAKRYRGFLEELVDAKREG